MQAAGTRAYEAYQYHLGELIQGARLVPVWSPDGQAVSFLEGPAEQRAAWRVDLSTGEKAPLMDVAKAREALGRTLGYTPPGRGVPFAQFGFTGPNTIAAQIGTDAVTLDLESYEALKLPAPNPFDDMRGLSERARATPQQFMRTHPHVDPLPALELLSPDGTYWLSTQDHNLALRSTNDGRRVLLTTDGTPEVEWRFGLTEPLLASAGLAVPAVNFSPDGTRLAAYRVDNRGVAQIPQVHWLKRHEEVVYRYLGKAGDVLERYTLHLVDLHGRAPVEINLGDTRDTYPAFAGWIDGGARLVIFSMSRDCRRVRVLLADAATGATTPVFTEEGESFVRIHHDVYFGRKLGLTITPSQQMLWLSERSGWQHVYLYDLDGTPVRQLTEGEWVVDGVQGVHDGFVYLTGRPDPERPYDVHLCRVPLEGGDVQQLTEGQGVHQIMWSPDRTVFLDTWSNPSTPPVHELRKCDGRRVAEVAQANISALKEVGWQPPEQFTVKAADGETDLWGVLYKPYDFDPEKRYPVIEFIYGGPQIAIVPHGFTTPEVMGSQAQALAQLGYIGIVLDGRGTPGRSKAFHDANYGGFANCLADDHAEAIRQLGKRYPYIDTSRVGIMGHSWGGFSAFRCLVDRPDVYKAAVTSAPGFNPYKSNLYECYLGLPQENPEAYRFASNLLRADKVQGALMIVVGTSDHSTWPDAVKMSEALIRAGKQHEFVVLPEQYHGFDEVHKAYFYRKVEGFFAGALQ